MAKAYIFVPRSREQDLRMIASKPAREIGEQLGAISALRRASRVEPTADLPEELRQQLIEGQRLVQEADRLWAVTETGIRLDANAVYWADLSPVAGPLLGPFVHREQAIDTEIAWLLEHNIPVREVPDERTHPGVCRDRDGV